MKTMISDFKHLRNCSLLGLVLVVSACFPQNGDKVYPYNYDPKNPYYLREVREDISDFDALSDEEIFLRAQKNAKDVSFADMDQKREIEGEELFAPMEGMVFTPLFSQPVRSDYERFLRLEHAVQVLRNDVDVLIPKVFKMQSEPAVVPLEGIDMERRTKPALIIKNEAYDPDVPMDIAKSKNLDVVEKLVVKKAPKKTVKKLKKLKAKKAYKAVARAFRRADHADKTRVVIDLSAKKNVSAVISGDGKRLIVDLSSVNWRPKKIWNALSGKLISGYKLHKGNKLFVDLMYKSKIAKKMLIKPNKDSRNYRLVIDLVSPHLHKKK